jgi:hypothetical protein
LRQEPQESKEEEENVHCEFNAFNDTEDNEIKDIPKTYDFKSKN